MLNGVGSGTIQLPDFQRGWVWDDHHIKDLIASVSQSFPIGAVMTLVTGGADVNFKSRPIEGVDESIEQVSPETLVLDGQQRLTSLFQSLKAGKPVETRDTRNNRIRRWYYLDMKKCMSDDFEREEAVISVPEDRIARTFRGEISLDLSSPEKEYGEDMFPLQDVFNPLKWMQGYVQHWQLDNDKWNFFNEFNGKVIENFQNYQVPVITLSKDTPKEAVCIVFEKVNQGGVSLTVFELLTASFSADDFQLRDDWNARQRSLQDNRHALGGVDSSLFLQALTLLATKEKGGAVSCRRRDILRLEAAQYKALADKVEDGFVKAYRFLHEQKIFSARDVPYRTQLAPLAAIFADLQDAADADGARQKIARWFWCGVFGEMYGGANETRFVNDFVDVTRSVRDGGEEPRTVRDANFQPNRLLSLRTRNSAAYKGIHALLMRNGSLDFRSGLSIEDASFFDYRIDIHHIFPRAWCGRNRITRDVRDSIINKTAISARTNRSIGGRAPSAYLNTLERNAGIEPDRMNEILKSHCIPAAAIRADDFRKFFSGRAEMLTQRIEKAMGKRIAREEGLFELD